jgi:hypothetical protein
MDCPFDLPLKKIKLRNITNSLYDIEQLVPPYTKEQADYIVQVFNSYEKLVRVIEETNQCFKCKFGYRQQSLTCPDEADAELPCAGFVEEHKGLNYLEQALKETENPK